MALERLHLLARLHVPDFDFAGDRGLLHLVPHVAGCGQAFAIGAKGKGVGQLELPFSVSRSWPVCRSQSFTLWSSSGVASSLLSGLKATAFR